MKLVRILNAFRFSWGLSVQAQPKVYHKTEPLMYQKAVSERRWIFSCCESHRHKQGPKKKTKLEKKLLLSITHTHTHVTFFYFPMFSRYARGLSLNTSCDMCREETAVVRLLRKPCERACVVCVLCRWHHTFHDVDVAKAERWGGEHTLFNWSSLSHEDPCKGENPAVANILFLALWQHHRYSYNSVFTLFRCNFNVIAQRANTETTKCSLASNQKCSKVQRSDSMISVTYK